MDKLVQNVVARFKKKTVEELQQVDDKGVHKQDQQGAVEKLKEQDLGGVHDQSQQGAITRPTPTAEMQQQAVSPPDWEETVKHMKKHKEIDNPWALAWYMKNKGYEPHKEGRDFKKLLAANAELKVILRAAAYKG